jgi:hypothetical protein
LAIIFGVEWFSYVGRHGSRTPLNAKPPIKASVFATTKTMLKSSRMTAMIPRRRIEKVKGLMRHPMFLSSKC